MATIPQPQPPTTPLNTPASTQVNTRTQSFPFSSHPPNRTSDTNTTESAFTESFSPTSPLSAQSPPASQFLPILESKSNAVHTENVDIKLTTTNGSAENGVVKARPQGSYTIEEVKLHNREGDLWVVVKNEVYDLTSFANEHPGGKKIILNWAGKDATKPVEKYHRPAIITRHKAELKIGAVAATKKKGLGRLFGRK